MYQEIIHTENAEKLPLPQDAWILYRFENHEIIRLDLAQGADLLRLLVIKTTDSG